MTISAISRPALRTTRTKNGTPKTRLIVVSGKVAEEATAIVCPIETPAVYEAQGLQSLTPGKATVIFEMAECRYIDDAIIRHARVYDNEYTIVEITHGIAFHRWRNV